ncbi:hypothetical protein MRX96_035129 [Rhipicephalus microplus]
MTSGRRRSGAARRQQQRGPAAYSEEKQRPLLVVPRRCCHGSFLSGTSSVCEALRSRRSSGRRRSAVVSLNL